MITDNSAYVCLCCGHKFKTPVTDMEKTGVTFDDGGEETAFVKKCPVCGMEELQEITVCLQCGGETERKWDKMCRRCTDKVRWSFREYLKTLSPMEQECLDELLDGTSVLGV